MAEKLVQGDSLATEVYEKFNGMADEVNELKESGVGSGGAVVELSGESGTLTDEQYAQCILPNTTIKWLNGSGGNMIYEPWRFVSPTYYFKSVYIDADECINNTIEIDQINHSWVKKSTEYSGGGSTVSVTQTLTSGTEIGAITVDGKTTALYAPEGGGSGGGGGSVSADAIIDVEELPAEENAYLFQNGAKVEEYLMRKVVVHIVDTLPEVGEPLLTGSPSATMNVYYQKGDDEAYCYFTESVKPGYNYVGWSTLASGCAVLSITYGGIVTDESQATESDTLYLVYHAAEYINTQAIYRVPSIYDAELGFFAGGVYVPNGATMNGMLLNIIVVDTLPEVGTVFQGAAGITPYLSMSDGGVFGYDENAGWLNLIEMGVLDGIISSPQDAADPEGQYLLITPKFKLYHYINGWHEIGGSSSGSSGGSNVKRFIFEMPTDGMNDQATTENGYTSIPLTENATSVCKELFSFIESSITNISNVRFINSMFGANFAATLFGTILYIEVRNGGISNDYIIQMELGYDKNAGTAYLKAKSEDIVAGFLMGVFEIAVITV